jgi:hypothetical protein
MLLVSYVIVPTRAPLFLLVSTLFGVWPRILVDEPG